MKSPRAWMLASDIHQPPPAKGQAAPRVAALVHGVPPLAGAAGERILGAPWGGVPSRGRCAGIENGGGDGA